MEQRNYKEIAEIIKSVDSGELGEFAQGESYAKKMIALKLADYFEKEDLELCAKISYEENKSNVLPSFDRKQFLKDCGV